MATNNTYLIFDYENNVFETRTDNAKEAVIEYVEYCKGRIKHLEKVLAALELEEAIEFVSENFLELTEKITKIYTEPITVYRRKED